MVRRLDLKQEFQFCALAIFLLAYLDSCFALENRQRMIMANRQSKEYPWQYSISRELSSFSWERDMRSKAPARSRRGSTSVEVLISVSVFVVLMLTVFWISARVFAAVYGMDAMSAGAGLSVLNISI